MQLNIEEQIPILTRVYQDNQILIPKDVRQKLNVVPGDIIEMYATIEGIFLVKQEKTEKGGE